MGQPTGVPILRSNAYCISSFLCYSHARSFSALSRFVHPFVCPFMSYLLKTVFVRQLLFLSLLVSCVPCSTSSSILFYLFVLQHCRPRVHDHAHNIVFRCSDFGLLHLGTYLTNLFPRQPTKSDGISLSVDSSRTIVTNTPLIVACFVLPHSAYTQK
jgi:hypothetical protein